ncbi:MAG: c-type cytochrome [Methylocella sp.]
MAREKGAFRLANPWPRFAWLTWAAIVGISFALGFLLLGRYQQNAPTLGLWGAICRGLGITADIGPAREAAPPLRTPSRIAWTSSTLGQIREGNEQHGSFIALNCTACHGEGGVSQSTFIPTLAGMDPAVIFKQLDDYRSGKRPWGVMGAIAKALSIQDSADVAAYFAARPNGLAAIAGGGSLHHASASNEGDSARRLAFIGDEQRGVPPCTACHGPNGYKIGAPPLAGQHAAYIERQLAAFAQGLRQNDINEQMRTIATQLTLGEMHALAAFYGAPESTRVTNK